MGIIQIKIDKNTYMSSADIDINIIEEEDCLPKTQIDITGIHRVDVFMMSEHELMPTNLQEACQIIAHELQKYGDFYNAFVSSVESAIEESPSGTYCSELADRIVKRISGEK